MKIEIIDTPRGRRFLWIHECDGRETVDFLDYTARELTAPYGSQWESIEIWREGKQLTPIGSIRWVGTHADFPSFCNLPLFGYCSNLMADQFQVGDNIVIHPASNRIPRMQFDQMYWFGMIQIGFNPADSFYR